jgi:uncharacterized protein (DUF1684 family)
MTIDEAQASAQQDALRDVATLLDWRRRVFELYHDVRANPEPSRAWEHWRATRDELLTSHPQSPVAPNGRAGYAGARYFGYHPRYRVTGEVVDAEPVDLDIATSRWSTYRFTRFASVRLELHGRRLELDCFWLQGYGGGLFLPFSDPTNGTSTYGGGRYLLDTVKGADLGVEDGGLVLDFNFAYNPSCAYDPRWVCPLAPAANRLPVPVEAGERT